MSPPCARARVGAAATATQRIEPLAIQYRQVQDLIPYARNARTHSPAQVAEIAGSIREFGFTNPVLIDPEGGIIAGHGRVLELKELLAPYPSEEMMCWPVRRRRRSHAVLFCAPPEELDAVWRACIARPKPCITEIPAS